MYPICQHHVRMTQHARREERPNGRAVFYGQLLMDAKVSGGTVTYERRRLDGRQQHSDSAVAQAQHNLLELRTGTSRLHLSQHIVRPYLNDRQFWTTIEAGHEPR